MDLFSKNSHKRSSKRSKHRPHKSRASSSDDEVGKNRRNSAKVSSSKSSEQADEHEAVQMSSHRKHGRSSSRKHRHSSAEKDGQETEGMDKDQFDKGAAVNTGTYIISTPSPSVNGGDHLVTNEAGLADIGKTVGTIQSTEVYSKIKWLEKYEQEKKRKKEKLRAEIDELRQKRDNMKVALQLEHLNKESDLLEKQKQLNQFDEELVSRQERLFEREKEIKESLKQIEEAEGALERRQDIVQRKQEDLTTMSISQNVEPLQQQLEERKNHLRRQSIGGSLSNQQTASLNWDFLRGVFHDRNLMLTGALKASKADLAHTENKLMEKTKEADNTKRQMTDLQVELKSKERKIKELEQHLTLTLQELKSTNKELLDLKEPEQNLERQKSFPKRPTRDSLHRQSSNVQEDFSRDKYVSQTCRVM